MDGRRTRRLAGLALLALATFTAWRWAGGLARSWAAIWEHYHGEVLAGYDDLDQLDDLDIGYDPGAHEAREQLAREFRAASERLARDVRRPGLGWGQQGDPRFEPYTGRIDPELVREQGPYPYRWEIGPGGRLIDHRPTTPED
jgi:hypothetical protein